MNAITPLIDRYIQVKNYGLEKAVTSEAITWNKEKAVPEFDIGQCTLCPKCIEEVSVLLLYRLTIRIHMLQLQ